LKSIAEVCILAAPATAAAAAAAAAAAELSSQLMLAASRFSSVAVRDARDRATADDNKLSIVTERVLHVPPHNELRVSVASVKCEELE